MRRSTVNIVIFLALLSLAGIVVTQIYWVQRAYNIEEKQFNDRVVIAMSAVVDRIQSMKNDQAIVEPVKQETSNFFVANINDTLHPYLLETLLKEEFTKSNLTEDFEYGIYDCFNDSIVFGSRLRFSEETVVAEQEDISIQKRFNKDGHYFGIYFPNKTNRIVSNMDFWVFSSILILFVAVFFGYAISIILRQKRLSEVKTDFINNMTHELKTPISTISLSSEVLLQKDIAEKPDRIKQYASIIQNENNRLKTQVEKVLEIATLTPDKVKLKPEPLDIHEILHQAIQSFSIKLEESGGTINTSFDADPHYIRGDRVHITNILHNLLDNAIKYNDKKPVIDIRTSSAKGAIQIEVEDNGIGIESKHHRQIFEKFFRVPTGDLHDVKGFGLGLYYVQTIVRAHGGKIHLKSQLGQGTHFTIAFNSYAHE